MNKKELIAEIAKRTSTTQKAAEQSSPQAAEKEEDDEDNEEIDKGLRVLREKKDIFRNPDLAVDAGLGHEALHALTDGFAEIVEEQLAAEEKGRVMRNGPSEELLEYELEHKQHQQRLEDAPADAEHRPLVLFLEIALDQLLEEELVLSQPQKTVVQEHSPILYQTFARCVGSRALNAAKRC